MTAQERDVSALVRDRAAEARDLEDGWWDAEIASLTAFHATKRRGVVGRSSPRAAGDRQRAASDRARAAGDRVLAAEDRAPAAADREADEVDMLTGARRRAPGLAGMQRDIDRAHRSNGPLIAAYVDVDGLTATNDSKGHHAGDVMLKHIVAVLQTHLRAYEPVVRLGGDEFVCTISHHDREHASAV